jgi:hypothetical protein
VVTSLQLLQADDKARQDNTRQKGLGVRLSEAIAATVGGRGPGAPVGTSRMSTHDHYQLHL